MAAKPTFKDPSPLLASNFRALQNLPPSSPAATTPLLDCRSSGPPQALFQALHPSLTAGQEYASADPSSSRRMTSSVPEITQEALHKRLKDEQHYHQVSSEEEEKEEEKCLGKGEVEGVSFEKSGSDLKRHQRHRLAEVQGPSAAHTYENPRDILFRLGRTSEAQGASVDEGGPEEGMYVEASDDDQAGESSGGQQSSQGESENYGTQHTDGSDSSGKDTIHHLSLEEGEKGRQVSPLRALSHIAHIKRKQDCLQMDFGPMQPDALDEFASGIVHESSSKRKKLRQVQFQLDPLAYQKLMRILAEQHQGSFERFIMATLDSISLQDDLTKRAAAVPKKPAFAKWKRTRFDQLKGTETEELAIAFRSLAKSNPNVEVTLDLMHVPWQELNMLQLQKMLEETKRMLLTHEKVHDCPFPDCGRRFATPGSLKDHLNEHSGEQPYSCSFEDCPHRFRSKQHLCRHMKKHERAHTCTFEGCNKRFAFRERLIVHQKIHSDERPLSCPWEGCGKTFKWANSLHGHMRTHTGEKPFQCTFAGCGRLFGYKVDLTRHRRTHFGQPARANH